VHLQARLDLPVRSGRASGTARLRRSALPAPLHLAGSVARYRWLSPADRVRMVRAVLALRRVDRADPAADESSFGAWLAAHGQRTRAVEALWDLIGVATLNAPADRASLALAATVFQIGLLESTDAADIGWSAVPLQHLHGAAAERTLADAGARVLTGARATALEPAGPRWRVRVEDRAGTHDEVYDDVVVATPAETAEALLPPPARAALPPGWAIRLGNAPILNLHLVVDRRVLDEPFVATVDTPLQWVFDRTVPSGLEHGQYLAVSISAADDLVGRPVAELRDWAMPHLVRVLPRLRGARVQDFFVTREPRATFRAAPGSARWRPAPGAVLPGLHLAGSWTATGWPATMEGAVRSGEAALASVLGASAPHAQEVPA
jgi:squalene-associated FAD-dependent desaturase